MSSPFLSQKAVHYTRALARWIKAGRPIRSEAEINHLLEMYCNSCEMYDAQNGIYQHCGCHVNRSTNVSLNKLAMKTEVCPLKKW
ncbi:MAG: hypothetical protein Q4C70_09560 [Planctomycetia bacterium]|nr:hypothetical protein [Planctomycetia bacterium]